VQFYEIKGGQTNTVNEILTSKTSVGVGAFPKERRRKHSYKRNPASSYSSINNPSSMLYDIDIVSFSDGINL
jgi:hypothetical protein